MKPPSRKELKTAAYGASRSTDELDHKRHHGQETATARQPKPM